MYSMGDMKANEWPNQSVDSAENTSVIKVSRLFFFSFCILYVLGPIISPFHLKIMGHWPCCSGSAEKLMPEPLKLTNDAERNGTNGCEKSFCMTKLEWSVTVLGGWQQKDEWSPIRLRTESIYAIRTRQWVTGPSRRPEQTDPQKQKSPFSCAFIATFRI